MPGPQPVPANYRADKPAYWMVLLVDDNGCSTNARGAWKKCRTPAEAALQAYGIGLSPGMRIYDLGPRLDAARKVMKLIHAADEARKRAVHESALLLGGKDAHPQPTPKFHHDDDLSSASRPVSETAQPTRRRCSARSTAPAGRRTALALSPPRAKPGRPAA